MGYHSDFTLKIYGETPKNLSGVLRKEIFNLFDEPYMLTHFLCDGFNAKWYDFVEDMERVSLHYPATLFEVHRLREDAAQTKVYFKNGKSQVEEANITFSICKL